MTLLNYSYLPIQFRGPNENGRKQHEDMFSVSSGENLSGLNLRASFQTLSSLCRFCIGISTSVFLGIIRSPETKRKSEGNKILKFLVYIGYRVIAPDLKLFLGDFHYFDNVVVGFHWRSLREYNKFWTNLLGYLKWVKLFYAFL